MSVGFLDSQRVRVAEHERTPRGGGYGRFGDVELVALVARGEDGALGELYDRHSRLAYGVAVRVLRDPTLAEDAMQDAFLQLWRSACRFAPERSSVRSWIAMLAHRRAIDGVRREERQRRLPDDQEQVPPEVSADEAAELGQERRRVIEALSLLPAEQRAVLELAYYGGLTQGGLADHLGVPVGTVKSRTFAGLARMRELLADAA